MYAGCSVYGGLLARSSGFPREVRTHHRYARTSKGTNGPLTRSEWNEKDDERTRSLGQARFATDEVFADVLQIHAV